MIIFGRRLFGRTDYVTLGSEREPGYHVATLFFHVQFIPLIPLSSHLFLGFIGGDNRAVSIPLNGKSVGIAWLRCVSWWATVLLGIWQLFIPFIVALSFACVVTWHGFFNDASYQRANELLEHIKGGERFDVAMKRMIDASYMSQSLENADMEQLALDLVIPLTVAELEEGGVPQPIMPNYTDDLELSEAPLAVPVGTYGNCQNHDGQPPIAVAIIEGKLEAKSTDCAYSKTQENR